MGSRRGRALVATGLAAGLALALATTAPSALGPYPSLGSKCGVFPEPGPGVGAGAASLPDQRAWNQDVSEAPLDPRSERIIDYINAHGGDELHPDFGSPREYGIPYAGGRQAPEAHPGPVHRLRRRVRPRALPGPARLAGRGRQALRRRPPRARLRPRPLQALRALPGLPPQAPEALGAPTRA